MAAFASPALAEGNVTASDPNSGSAANAGDYPYPSPSKETAAASDECQSLQASVEEKVRAFLEHQGEIFGALLARQESDHKAFHEKNVSDADEKAFHERQAKEASDLKIQQRADLDHYTVEAWRAYQDRCDKTSAAQRADAPPADLPAECREKWSDLKAFMAEVGHKWEARHKEFQLQFDAARAEYRHGNHTDAEWKAFDEKWNGEARRLFEASDADMRAQAEKAGLLKCWLPYHMKAREQPVPSYKPKESREPVMDEGARKIMERCQARMQQLMAEMKARYGDMGGRSDYQTARDGAVYPTRSSTPFADENRPAVQPTSGDDREFRERLMKLKAECEAEMKAYLDQKHSSEKGDFGSFVTREEDGKIYVDGKFLSMIGLPERQMMTEIAVNKKVLIDALFANGYLADFRPAKTEQGSAIFVFDAAGNQILGVHDNPRAVIKLSTSSEIDAITLDLNDNLQLSQDSEGIRFEYGEWKGALQVHKGSVEMSDGNVLVLHGKATFLVTNVFREKERLGDKYQDAVLQKKVGAEVNFAKDGKSDATALTDLDIKDAKLEGRKLSAKFDAPDGQGKTVVFKVETGLFKCDGLKVKLYGVNQDGTESSLEISEAKSLEDVLDPADDGPDGFEYWCVSDKDGQQILVSIAHFSEKRVEVESAALEDALKLVPGFEATILVAAAGVALVLIGLRRRP